MHKHDSLGSLTSLMASLPHNEWETTDDHTQSAAHSSNDPIADEGPGPAA